MSKSANVTDIDEYKLRPDRTPTQWARYWADEYEAARKRNRKFRTQGNDIVQRFLDERNQGNAPQGE